jgi:Carboxypeptidase regulatory-like domain/TonB dependent receptor/TonB-dependent Receptor Plug Domain
MSVSAFGGLRGRWVLGFLVGLVLFQTLQPIPSAFAQSELATVSGRVTDPSGAVVLGAEVEVKNVETNVSLVRTTNSDGLYSIPSLHPGHYMIFIRKPGFRTVSVRDVTLNVQDQVVRNIQLQVGSTSESITVTAESEKINTTDGSVSTVIERETVENMPLNGRSFQSLLELTPGVNAFNPSASSGSLSDQGQFAVNGQRSSTNYFTVDGVSANTGTSQSNTLGQAGTGSLPGTTALGGFNDLVSVDALQEFRVTTSTFAPEYGRTPGAQVALSSRSGTNSYHGDVFDYLRNTALDANDWFLNRAGKPRGTERQNDFGGVFGGPIIRDKLFFFLSYEGLRLANPTPGTVLTPTKDARHLAQIAQNSSGAAGYMYQFLNAYPLPDHDSSTGDGSTCIPSQGGPDPCLGQFTNPFPNHSQVDSGSARIDYALNSKMALFGRYVHAPSSTVASGGSGFNISSSNTAVGSDSATVGFVETISSTVVNDLRFNYTRSTNLGSDTPPSAFGGSLSSIFPAGFAQIPAGYSPRDVALSLSVLGFGGQGINIDPAGSNSRQTQYNIVDSLSFVKGAHTLKFGADFRLTNPNINLAADSFSANFGGGGGGFVTLGGGGGGGGGPFGPPALACIQDASGVPVITTVPAGTPALPNYICGLASNINIQHNFEQDFRFQNWSLFAQDAWKATSRLTLTYGVRYEVDPAPYSLNGKPFFSLNNWDPLLCEKGPGGPPSLAPHCNVGVNPLGTAPYPTTWGNIAPRIGVAYQMSRNPNWTHVLRAGFGIFYDTAADASSATAGPFSPTASYPATNPSPGAPPIPFPISASGMCGTPPVSCSSLVTPPSPQQSISPTSPYSQAASAAAPNLKLPYVYQFNVAIQQALGSHQSFTATYVGGLGRNLIGPVFYIPFVLLGNGTVPVSPSFTNNLTVYGNYASSDYHALQAQFQRQFYHGLGSTVSYTWSHSIDDASNFNSGLTFPLSTSRSSSDFDIRHTFAASLIYNIPTPFKSNGFASAALGHWSVAPIYHLQTAAPVNIIGTIFSNSGGVPIASRPNVIPGVPVYVYGAQCAAENQAATGVYACPGGKALNNALPFTSGGATMQQLAAAGCIDSNGAFTAAGAFCVLPFNTNSLQGNAGRNFARGYPLHQLDLDFNREFTLEKAVHLRLEADFFNLFNQPNFASPANLLSIGGRNIFPAFGLTRGMANTALGSGGGFNQLYALGGPRSVQLALKIFF